MTTMPIANFETVRQVSRETGTIGFHEGDAGRRLLAADVDVYRLA